MIMISLWLCALEGAPEAGADWFDIVDLSHGIKPKNIHFPVSVKKGNFTP